MLSKIIIYKINFFLIRGIFILQVWTGEHIVLRRKNDRKGKMSGALLPTQKMQEKERKEQILFADM